MPNLYKQSSCNSFFISDFGNHDLNSDSTIKRITQKINQMSKNQQNNLKLSEFTNMQNRIQDIQGKLQESLKSVEKTIKIHRQTLSEMNQKLNEIQSRNQLSKKVRNNQIKQLQSKMNLWINMEKKNRALFEEKIIQNFQDKIGMISTELSRQIDQRKQYLSNLDEKLAQALPLLKNQILEEIASFSVSIQNLQHKLQITTENFKQSLKKNEEDHNQKIGKVMHLLTETVEQVKKQIEDQRYQRQQKKNQILELFQGAYKKLVL